MDVDHGLTVPLSMVFGQPEAWPCKVIPAGRECGAVPIATDSRCLRLGHALRKAVASYDRDLRVMVWGTGGMSHQLQGPRADLANSRISMLASWTCSSTRPSEAASIRHVDYLRESSSGEASNWSI